jgi:hypothetical protein
MCQVGDFGSGLRVAAHIFPVHTLDPTPGDPVIHLSLPKTAFVLRQLHLHGRNDSLQTLCLRSFSRCSAQFGKDFELGLRFKPRSLPFGISSWSFSAQHVHARCV